MKDFVELGMMELPGYMEWSQRRLDGNEAYIAHLDATRIVVRREELGTHTDTFFDQLLADLAAEFETGGEDAPE